MKSMNKFARLKDIVKIRAGPSTSSDEIGKYITGKIVKYDKTVNNDGRKWISFKDNTGVRRYCCAIDKDGTELIELGVDEEDDDNNIINIIGNGPQTVLASYFDDKIGYRDNDLYDGGLYYAELKINPNKKDFSSLGGLPYRKKLRITYKGKSAIAYKGDVGIGGPSHPKINIHANLAKELGFPKGVDYVEIKDI